MSKRTFFSCHKYGMRVFAFLLLSSTVLLFNPLSAQDIDLTISNVTASLGDTIDVEVTIENSSALDLGGIVLAVAYDTLVLTWLDGTPGEFSAGCGWSFPNDPEEPKRGLVRFVGISDFLPCNFDSLIGPLITLSFVVNYNPQNECIATPIQFYWDLCPDNSMSDSEGLLTLFSNNVYHWAYPDSMIQMESNLPTIFGAPDSCAVFDRRIDFHNGFVDIFCLPDPSDRGDLNLNAIAYELADYVIYQTYYLYGLSAFTINIEEQIANSDINADGIVLTLADLAYLYRVIIGDALPIPNPEKNSAEETAVFTQDRSTKTISLDFVDSLVIAYLNFDGEIIPESMVEGMAADYSHSGGTLVLVSPDFQVPDVSLMTGAVLTYTGEADLTGAQVADFQGRTISTVINIIGDNPICGDADGSGEVDISDAIYIVRCIFAFGPCPPVEIADVDCNSVFDISDVVYLIAYIFQGGPAPCASCP